MTASDGVVHQTKESLSDSGADICSGRLLPTGTLMFSFKLSIGQMAYAGHSMYTNEAIAGLIPVDAQSVDVNFLKHSLAVADYEDLTGYAVKGKTLNRKTLTALPVALPPLDEQHRIAGQMAMVERARSAAAAQLASIGELNTAMLQQIFS